MKKTDDDAEELKEESKFDVGGTMCIDDEEKAKSIDLLYIALFK